MILEKKYINYLASSLNRFTSKPNNTYNFRCPFCNDSKKSKSIARGYLLNRSGKYNYYCHNCHISLSFRQFLEQTNVVLYDEYIRELYDDTPIEKIISLPNNHIFSTSTSLRIDLPKISNLKPSHPAKQYIISRAIPTYYHSRLFYTDNFKSFTNKIVPDTFQDVSIEESRIIIPMYGRDKSLIGFQGRSISENSNTIRYITKLIKPDYPKIFNLDITDFNRKFYAMEGPFDAMFITNSIASCGGLITSEILQSSLPVDNAVIVYDNEPRNPEIIKNVSKAISQGFSVCIWPKSMYNKDINDMILAEKHSSSEQILKTSEYIKHTIDSNTFFGLEAELMLSSWKQYK